MNEKILHNKFIIKNRLDELHLENERLFQEIIYLKNRISVLEDKLGIEEIKNLYEQ